MGEGGEQEIFSTIMKEFDIVVYLTIAQNWNQLNKNVSFVYQMDQKK